MGERKFGQLVAILCTMTLLTAFFIFFTDPSIQGKPPVRNSKVHQIRRLIVRPSVNHENARPEGAKATD